MAKKRVWLGVLAMALVLVFGMAVVGCDLDEGDTYYIKVTNGTNFNITLIVVEGVVVATNPSGVLAPTESKTYALPEGSTGHFIKVTVRVDSEDVVVEGGSSNGAFPGEQAARVFIVSGTSKENLRINVY